jgi:hypothetical protein
MATIPNTPFHERRFWENYGLTSDYIERIEVIQSLIPRDVETLLDIGCGRCDIINSIADTRNDIRIVGVDMHPEALKYCKTQTVTASLPDIPFADKYFDIVLCLQVLEHIPEEEYVNSLREIERLSRHYIIIGVPFRENLLSKTVLCSDCGTVSHADGHLRRYNHSTLKHMFKDFILEEVVLAGKMQKRQSIAGIWLKQNLSGSYYRSEEFLCPHCGSGQYSGNKFNSPVIVQRFFSLLNSALTRLKRAKPYWIIGLYRREHAA